MTYALRGPGWENVATDPLASAVFLVWIRAGGHHYHISTRDIHVKANGRPTAISIYFRGAVLGNPQMSETVDVFTKTAQVSSLSLEVLVDAFPLDDLRRAGICLQNIEVDIFWHIEGVGLHLLQAFHLLRGYLTRPLNNEEAGTVKFTVVDTRLEGDLLFPPIASTISRLTNLDVEYSGKPYPVIFGSGFKVPIYDISAGHTKFLTMHDPYGEHAGTPVSVVYNGDTVIAGAPVAQGHGVDGEGNGYWYCDLAADPGTKSLTADIDGFGEVTLESVIKRLVNFYSRHTDDVDVESYDYLHAQLDQIEVGMVVNDRVSGGVLKFIRDRLSRQFPFVMLQRERKYGFWPVLWTREINKVLSTDSNIVRKIAGPTETDRVKIYNSFVVRYGRNLRRGDYIGTVERNPTNNQACYNSAELYGSRAMFDVDLGDASTREGAELVVDWLIETFSKMRVFVSYACTLAVVDVVVLEGVRVYDLWEGWDHGPLFKVIGIHRGEGTEIRLDLISIDSHAEVYNTNRSEAASNYAHVFTPVETHDGWGDDGPEYKVPIDGGWSDDGPEFGG